MTRRNLFQVAILALFGSKIKADVFQIKQINTSQTEQIAQQLYNQLTKKLKKAGVNPLSVKYEPIIFDISLTRVGRLGWYTWCHINDKCYATSYDIKITLDKPMSAIDLQKEGEKLGLEINKHFRRLCGIRGERQVDSIVNEFPKGDPFYNFTAEEAASFDYVPDQVH